MSNSSESKGKETTSPGWKSESDPKSTNENGRNTTLEVQSICREVSLSDLLEMQHDIVVSQKRQIRNLKNKETERPAKARAGKTQRKTDREETIFQMMKHQKIWDPEAGWMGRGFQGMVDQIMGEFGVSERTAIRDIEAVKKKILKMK